jgi:hypothetical protein
MIDRHRALALLNKFLPLISAALVLAALPLMMQYLHLLDIWAVRHWFEVFTGPYIVNAIMVTLLFLCCYTIFNSVFFGLIATTVLCLTFSIIDMQKMRVLEQPLLPGDLFFIKQALLIAKIYFSQAFAGLLAIAAIIAASFFLKNRVRHYRMRAIPRSIMAALLCVIIASGSRHFDDIIAGTNKHFNITDEFWDQLSNYQKNGVY